MPNQVPFHALGSIVARVILVPTTTVLCFVFRFDSAVFVLLWLQGPIVYGEAVSIRSMRGKGKYLRVTSSGAAVFAR